MCVVWSCAGYEFYCDIGGIVDKVTREEFEKWHDDNVHEGKDREDKYVRWETWQARQPEIDALREKCEELALSCSLVAITAHNAQKENASLKAENERLRKDAERFRWLCEDHDDKETRERRNRILDCFSVHSYSASCMDIDAAMKEAK